MDEFLNGGETLPVPEGPSVDAMARIRKVFVESMRLGVSPEDLSYERLLVETAILDSIAVLEFVAALETEFGVSIEPRFLEFDFLSDLPALASYLEINGRQHLKQRAARAHHR
jgi:acyl carrier protein